MGRLHTESSAVQNMVRLSALLGVLQNDMTAISVNQPPFLDLLESPKAAQAGIVIVEAAISDAGGLSRTGEITHLSELIHIEHDCIVRIGSHRRKGVAAIHHNDRMGLASGPVEFFKKVPRDSLSRVFISDPPP